MIRRTNQENISTRDGDVVAGNKEEHHYHNYSNRHTRLRQLFESLYSEKSEEKISGICEELNRYLTDKDPLGLEQKLTNGGFNEQFIIEAEEQKEYFAKKLYKYYEYESAQLIYVELLALIKANFQDYIYPLIAANTSTTELVKQVREIIVNPIIIKLETDAVNDRVLNLNLEEVKGMVYYLTGRCHINWTNDSI